MNEPSRTALDRLLHHQDELDALLARPESLAARARSLAQLLRILCPSCPLYACWLFAQNDPELWVLDESGAPRPPWAVLLRFALEPGTEAANNVSGTAQLPSIPELVGHVLAVERLRCGDREHGLLALALPEDAASTVAELRVLLRTCAGQLAPRLELEARARALQSLRVELAVQTRQALVGDLAGPLAHECNNFLNVVLLQLAVLDLDLPEQFRPKLAEIRRQGTGFKAAVHRFQAYRQDQASRPEPVKLDQVLRDAVEDLNRLPAAPYRFALRTVHSAESAERAALPGNALVLELLCPPDLPPVLASAPDLKRLLMLLVTSWPGTASGKVLTLRAEADSGTVWVRLQLHAGTLRPEASPPSVANGGMGSLEWAACQGLVRRLQGKIYDEKTPDAGLVVVVRLLPSVAGKGPSPPHE